MSNFLVKSTILITLSEIIFNISSFVIHAVVGRILGPEDYGRYGLVVTLTTMVIILIGNGIPTAMAKYISEIFESNPLLVKIIKRQTIILQTIVIGSITLLFYILAPVIAHILGDPELTRLFRISTLIIPSFAAASFYFSYFTGLHKFNIQAILKITRSIMRVIFIIGLAYIFKLEGSIAGYIIAPVGVFIIAYAIDKFVVNRELKNSCHCERSEAISSETVKSEIATSSRQGGTPRKDTFFPWKRLIDYAWQIVIFFLAYELLISIDLYLVQGILKDEYATGIYNASLTLGRLPYYLFYALTVILLPVISKTTYEKDTVRTAGIINQSVRIMLILLIPVIALMSVFSEPLIRLFYSDRFIGAALPMSILVWGVGFLTIYYVMCFVMSGANRVKKPMYISIIGLALNTLLNYFLIIRYGIIGSAIATSIASAVILFIMLYEIKKDFGVIIPLKTLAKTFFAGAIIFAVAKVLPGSGNIFILWSVVLFGLYLSLLYLMAEIKKEDILFFKNSLRRQPK